MRRFTRLTNAFSKKFENHCHALALYFFWYNWVRNHKTLGVTPAMAAGLVQTPMKFTDLLTAMDKEEENKLAEKRQALIDAVGTIIPATIKLRHYQLFTASYTSIPSIMPDHPPDISTASRPMASHLQPSPEDQAR